MEVSSISVAQTKTTEELILVLLFADDSSLLVHTEDALQTVVDVFPKAAQAFGLTISLKKTQVLHQNSHNAVYSSPQITINGHPLNSVEQFTYLGNVISNDATITKHVNHRLAKACSSFGRLQHREWKNHAWWPKSEFMWQSLSASFYMLRKPGCFTENTYSRGKASTRGACAPSWDYSGRTTSPTSRFQRGLDCLVSRLYCYNDTSAGPAMSRAWTTPGCPNLCSLTNSAKTSVTEVLHAGATRTSWSDSWHRPAVHKMDNWKIFGRVPERFLLSVRTKAIAELGGWKMAPVAFLYV